MARRSTRKAWARIGMIAAAFGYFVLAGVAAKAAEFSYSGDEGPGFWGELDPAWENCSDGHAPIPDRYRQRVRRDATLGPLPFISRRQRSI